jgi:hypothetical protein
MNYSEENERLPKIKNEEAQQAVGTDMSFGWAVKLAAF